MKKQIGRCQAAARLNVSSVEPILTAPSPKYVTATALVPACRLAQANPAACGTPPPTMALVHMAPACFHCRCMDPPRPWLYPRARPQISARVRSRTVRTSSESSSVRSSPLGATCESALARNWWWPRCEPLTASWLVKARIEPTAPPSCPMLECAAVSYTHLRAHETVLDLV